MKTSLFLLVLFISDLTLSQGIEFKTMNYQEAKELAIKSKKNLFVDVYIDNCAPCKYLNDKVFVNPELGTFMNEHFISIRMNADAPENTEFAAHNKLNSFPTLMYFDPSGELIRVVKGSKEATALLTIAKDHVFPEQSALFSMTKKYNQGHREKDFLQKYTVVLKENEMETKYVAREYATTFGIDPTSKEDLQMVLFAEFDAQSPFLKTIFDKIEISYSKEPVLVKKIVKQLVDQTIKEAVEKKDYSIVEKLIPVILPVYIVVIDPSMNEEKLAKHLKTKFDDYLFWGQKNVIIRTNSSAVN